MKKIFTCLLIVFFTQQIAFAQSNFKPGYIVTLKGDTLRGFIDYKQWNETPQEIRFKNTSNNIKPYNISNALAFGINGLDYFERHIVQVSMDEVELTKISTRDTSAKTDTVFLQMVTRGKNLNLYLYTDFTKSRLYVWPAGAPGPYELIYHVYMDIENANQVITQNTYRQQLIGLAYRFRKNDEKIVSDIQQAEYHEDDLMGIVDQINGSTHKTTASVHKYGHRFFAGAGVNIEALAYKGRIDLAFGATTQISYYPKSMWV